MDSKTYLLESSRTNTPDRGALMDRLKKEGVQDILHAMLGLPSEVGELIDQLKSFLFYGKEIDIVNFKEEIGDIQWFCALALRAVNSDFDEVTDMNIAKLKERYPDGFTPDKAINRDVTNERFTLEDNEA